MNRIEEKLKQIKEKKQKAFITYTTAGLPDLEGTKRLIKAQEKAGVDLIELLTRWRMVRSFRMHLTRQSVRVSH